MRKAIQQTLVDYVSSETAIEEFFYLYSGSETELEGKVEELKKKF